MSKILLIKPRFLAPGFQTITQPMGLMYIGAALKKSGHEPRIHDCALDYKDLHVLRRTITDWKPDFIGISIIVTEIETTKRVMEVIRGILPDVPVTFGGPWPSASPKESLKTFGANFVVIGEGELVFPELIDTLNRGIPAQSVPGTAFMADGRVRINPGRHLAEDELNAFPFPAWELVDHRLYDKTHSFATVGFRPYMSIVTSRGCPYKCAYCHRTMGKVFRKRSAQSVLAEMEELRFQYGFKEFEIIDDCFNLDRERMHTILSGIRDRIGDVKLHFPNGIRSDILEAEDMKLFRQAGTVSISFAIETASPRLQKMIRKNLNVEKALKIISASVKAGIYSSGFFMIGFPTESYEEARATVDVAVRSALHRATFFYTIPFAETELADMAADVLKKRKEALDPYNANYYTSRINISAMPDGELQKIFRSAYLRFYLNPKRLLELVIRHPRISSLPRYAFLIIIRLLRL